MPQCHSAQPASRAPIAPAIEATIMLLLLDDELGEAVEEDADAVEVEAAAEGDDKREGGMQSATSESQPPGPGRIRRQGESSRMPDNGLSVPDEMEELAEHTRMDEDGQRIVPAEDPQISPRIRNEESKEEDFRARNIEAAESYAGRFGQTQQSNQATSGTNSRQGRHYPSFSNATPLRPHPRHHGAPASSSTSPSMNYNFRSSPYLSQTLRSPPSITCVSTSPPPRIRSLRERL